jgi:hypothetical protein
MFPDGAIASCFGRDFSSLIEKNELSEIYFVYYDGGERRNVFSGLKYTRRFISLS